jgi:hypothetical protein
MEILQGMTDMLHNRKGKSKVRKPMQRVLNFERMSSIPGGAMELQNRGKVSAEQPDRGGDSDRTQESRVTPAVE